MAESITERLNQLKAKIGRATRDRDEAAGALKQSLDQLKKEYDCDSEDAARKELATLDRKLRMEQDRLDSLLEEAEKALR